MIKIFCVKQLRYLVLFVPFLLSACWVSERQLFDESLMVDPFGRAKAYEVKGKDGKSSVFIKIGRYFENPNNGKRYSFIPSHVKGKNHLNRYYIASVQTKGKPKTEYGYGYVDNKNAWHSCVLAREGKVNSIHQLRQRIKAISTQGRLETVCNNYGVAKTLSVKRAHQKAGLIAMRKDYQKSQKAQQQLRQQAIKPKVVTRTVQQTNSHSHAGRVHSHPLPHQGVHHRHGNGAYGVSNNKGQVVTYTETTTKHSAKAHAKKPPRGKIGVAKPPRAPSNLNGFYLVYESGAVDRISQRGSDIRIYSELANELGRGFGTRKGDLESRGTYSAKHSSLSIQNVLPITQNKRAFRHCGKIFSKMSRANILPIKLKDGSYSPNVWVSKSRSKTYCSIAQVSATSCRVVRCSKYEKRKPGNLLMKDRLRAIRIGSQRQRTYRGKTYAEKKAELRRYNRKQSKSKGSNSGGWSASQDAYQSTYDAATDWWGSQL
ncbi:hypothetical protein [Cocleimonas flava]|uniref:Uncharacterized protein n=1 Tax=Cocleimonas flava TaxID=634765 RepID=A0A4R1EN72_9GAMM|nr:hypothetical protein [Cocleimonas flava]TCJ82667.1 hypothetical protein EV695_3399 [Cocleimonas flava]